VSRSTYLSGEDYIASDFRAARETDLRTEERILSDDAGVTDLNQVVNL
jgi:hypothetical protein